MKPSDEIACARLTNQNLDHDHARSPADLVRWMGAMQAQDLSMVLWAVGIRQPGLTDADILEAINRGEIIRTHLMRPTWHLVAADDLRWITDLTAPRIRSSLRSRHRELEIDDSVISRSHRIIERALSGGRHLGRRDLVAKLEGGGISMEGNRASHLLMLAEIDGLVCSGPIEDGKHTYTLTGSRVTQAGSVSNEEAHARLATRYFQSHGPAGLRDFVWWSGLPVSAARNSIASLGTELHRQTVDGTEYYFHENSPSKSQSKSLSTYHFLPAYDEFLISYADRGAVLPPGLEKGVISNNGIFRPVIVADGQVVGVWKRKQSRDKVVVDVDLFGTDSDRITPVLEANLAGYGSFLGRRVEIGERRVRKSS